MIKIIERIYSNSSIKRKTVFFDTSLFAGTFVKLCETKIKYVVG